MTTHCCTELHQYQQLHMQPHTTVLQPGPVLIHTPTNQLQHTTTGVHQLTTITTNSQPMISAVQEVTSKWQRFDWKTSKKICQKTNVTHFFVYFKNFFRYPAGVNPHACPNYPYCDTGAHGSYHVPQVAPLPGYNARNYPAGVNPASCPNYPYCA